MAEIVKDLDFWRMAAMGQFIKTVVWGRKEATMYSYNGVVLPNIYKVYTPELQKTHPFAFITHSPVGFYTFFASPVEVFVSGSGVYPDGDDTHYGLSCSTPMFDDAPTTWGELGADGFGPNAGKIIPLWCNFDLRNTDGSVYLAKSEPVPIYE